MAKCNRDCFNCAYDDCIVDNMSSEERTEAKERDKKFSQIYFYGSLANARPLRAKNRKRYYD